jgi:hypothetical protein
MAEQQGSVGWSIFKGGIFVLGSLAAIGLALAIVKPVLIMTAIAGVIYVGYRVTSGGKPKALDPDADFNKKMRALEAAEKKYDDQIR